MLGKGSKLSTVITAKFLRSWRDVLCQFCFFSFHSRSYCLVFPLDNQDVKDWETKQGSTVCLVVGPVLPS